MTPVTTKYRGIGGALNVPTSCGGVSVLPGDIIMADENGVLVIPRLEAASIAEQALVFGKKEQDFLKLLAARPPLCYPDETGATEIVTKALARK